MSGVVQERSTSFNRLTGARVAPSQDFPGTFDEVPNREQVRLEALLEKLVNIQVDMRIELTALRLGMMAAGLCNEVSPSDAEQPLAMQ